MRGSRVSSRLRERGAAAWAAATSHPMVVAIGEGTLPHQVFRHYFEQNILYLADYARSIGLIIGKSPDLAATDVLARFLGQIAGIEIPANLAFLRRLGGQAAGPDGATGLALDPAAGMRPATYAYTRHLLYTCAQGSCAEGLAAVLPCQWSYGELARPLLASPPADPVYSDWIAMFGNDAYGLLVEETTGLLDRLAAGMDRADERLAPIFDASTRYEVQFWDMAYGVLDGTPGGKEPGHTCELPESSRI
ncbi:MAG TPA: TenA family protein [Streptosporangiaceae bacterium]